MHGRRGRRQRGAGRPAAAIERLEARLALDASLPTAHEQFLLEMVNRGRADPLAEATRYGIDLNEGLEAGTISAAAKQPLAFNPFLIDAAQRHSQWQLDTDTFSHTGAGGSTAGERMTAAGYDFTGSWTWGENIGWFGTTGAVDVTDFTARIHRGLFLSKGHRTNVMGETFREVGLGVRAGEFESDGMPFNSVMVTENFAASGTGVFLTGVAYDDTGLDDDFYTPGEGLGGVTITATRASDQSVFETTTWATGGYTLRLPSGTYTVVAAGAGLPRPVTHAGVSITTRNVKRDFLPLPDRPPTLTTIATLAGASRDVPYTITYDALAAAADESDPDGGSVQFRIRAVTSGTLLQGGAAVTPGTTLLAPGGSLTWIPAAGATGTLAAFTVDAWDGALASATEVPVRVEVAAGNGAPALSGVATLAGGRQDTPFAVTHALVAAAADEADPEGDPLSFRIEAVLAGTLLAGGTEVVPGVTLLTPTQTLEWLPPAGVTGTVEAFTIKAWDGLLASPTAVRVAVQVAADPNRAPTLTTVATLPGAVAGRGFEIGHAALLAAADEADADGEPISFRVEGVAVGSLTLGGLPVITGVTLLSPGGTLVWTAPADASGTIEAFSIRASDGRALSRDPVGVRVAVSQPNAAPTVAGLAASRAVVFGTEPFDLLLREAADADGSVARVEFFRDADGDGILEASDEALGPGTADETGWRWTGSAAGWPLGAQTLFARAVDDAGQAGAPAAVGVWTVERVGVVATSPSGRVTVECYDAAGPRDVSAAGVAVRFGRDDAIVSVTLVGRQAATGLGLVIRGASWIGTIADARTGSPGTLAFVASDTAAVGSVILKTGLFGIDLDGMPGGVAAEDVDGDGDASDRTALLFAGPVRSVRVGGPIDADVVVRGTQGAGVSLGSLVVAKGGMRGDLRTVGTIGAVDIGGDFRGGTIAAPALGSLVVRGDLAGATVALERGVEPLRRTLGSLVVGGWLDGTTVRSGGSVGPVTVGGMRSSAILAGVAAGVTGLPAMNADLAAGAALVSLTVRGLRDASNHSFIDSRVAATHVGTVSLRGVRFDNGGTPFGVASVSLRGLSTLQYPRTRHVFGRAWPADPGDFRVVDL
ncbi:MAG: CAP domain-containing protein [Planctomycetaceae bacterium]